MTDSLRIIPLGGLGEIGKNMTAVEYRGKIVVLDCGVEFPRDEMLGIDLIIPDIRWLLERRDDVLAFLITHGHEDHQGALPFVLKQLNKPVYGSRFTLALIKSKLDEHGLLKVVELNEVSETSAFRLGPFDVSFIATSHSVPDSLSIVLGTELGAVVLTGDYRFDHTPIDGRITDVNAFAQLGQKGVLALLGDSTNVETPGSTASEATVGQAFHQIFAEAEGRVIVASFASHIHRVQQAITIAHLHGRKFALSGRSMVKNANIARNLGYLDVPDGAMIKLTEIDDYRPEEILILSTGSQGEPLSALTRMAFNDHPQVALHEGDTVVISAKAIPGNERSVTATIDRLLKVGATVIYGEDSGIHVSGHAAQEDLRMMLNLVRPSTSCRSTVSTACSTFMPSSRVSPASVTRTSSSLRTAMSSSSTPRTARSSTRCPRAWCSSTVSSSATPRVSCFATASSWPATASSSPWSPSTPRAATRWRLRSLWRAASCTTTSASRRYSTSARPRSTLSWTSSAPYT